MLLRQPIIRPILVGRALELGTVDSAVAAAAAGQGRTLVVSGEAGIGKSRLSAAARERARAAGLRVLEGACYETDRALPFAPLLDLLGTYIAALPPAERQMHLGDRAADLAALSPALGGLLPGAVPSVGQDLDQQKHRLFETLFQLIAAPDAGQPSLVVVDDLHWCDDVSLEFLLTLARRAPRLRLLLLLTYRPEDEGPELRHFLAELDRAHLAVDIVLQPLSRSDLSAMMRAILAPAQRVPRDFQDALYTLTEGNPFFVEEVLKAVALTAGPAGPEAWAALLAEAVRIPRSIQDAVWRRLVQVSAPAQRLLSLAAVAGQRVDFALLETITGQDEATLLAQVKELIGAQLLVEVSAEQCAFRHALTRQAIYGQFLARERVALHRTIAHALQRLAAPAPEARLPELAYHTYQAGLWDLALEYARRMGERAQAMFAPHAAITHYSRAIEAIRHLGQVPDAGLWRARGQARAITGDFGRAEDDYQAALAAARQAAEPGGEWQALLDLGFLWLGRDYHRAGAFLRQACDLAGRLDDPHRLAHSLNRLGNWYANMDQPRQGLTLHREALAVFRRLDDQAGIAATLDLLAVATHIGGDRPAAIACFESAAAALRALDDRQGLASALATLGHLRSASAVYDVLPGATEHPDQAVRECEEALALAREIGWRPGEAYALSELAAARCAQGDFGRALASGQESLALAAEIAHGEWLSIAHTTLGVIYLALLDAPAALEHCEQGYAQARTAGPPHVSGLGAAFLAQAHLLARRPDRAAALLEGLMTPGAPAETLTQLALLATHAEVLLLGGDAAGALACADRLLTRASETDRSTDPPRVGLLRGQALAALQRTTGAEAALQTAATAARRQTARPLLWRIELTLGSLYESSGRRAEAEHAYSAARLTVEELAGALGDETLRATFLGRALQRIPTRRAPAPGPGGLTRREREIAALIARGLSNRDIAAALVVSERTVEAHTGHIRDKLGFQSRAQVAAWAVAQGLVRDPA